MMEEDAYVSSKLVSLGLGLGIQIPNSYPYAYYPMESGHYAVSDNLDTFRLWTKVLS